MLTRDELLKIKQSHDIEAEKIKIEDTQRFIKNELINKIKAAAVYGTRCLISNRRESYYSNDAHSCYYSLDLATIANYIKQNMPELHCQYSLDNEFLKISWE